MDEIKRTLQFTDGMEFNVGGPLRVEHRRDGWYVVGNGLLIPVGSAEEGSEIIREMAKK
jgi:hypothetical protein